MLAAFLEHPFFLNRHRQAPVLKERESFLSHLQQQGASRKALRNLSAELLQEVRLLKLTEMRDVSLEEIRRAARYWAPATRESKGTVLRQLCFILYICGEEVAAIPWAAQAPEYSADAVRGSTQRLRPVHDRGKRPLAIFGAVPLFADIKVPGMVQGLASVVGEGLVKATWPVVKSEHPLGHSEASFLELTSPWGPAG